MIKVQHWVYRVLWITCAALGAMLTSMPLMLLSEDVHANNDQSVLTIIAGGVIGAGLLAYSMWRLIRPLRPKPNE